ncbi:capsid protein [Clostridium botulinum]|nr:capsid protein [Clostridium botulinum]NFS52942.1 capsid protein [Clostridium botulinum]NFT16464.1 capsid protein [Clostridium botulinum]
MGIKILMNDGQKILLKRYLNKNGDAQVKFTKECSKEFNNYVPFKTGRLKDMSVELGNDYIKYNAPYASKQYYLNNGGSKGALRGKYWDKRCWNDKGDNIVKSIAEFVGGRSK